MDWAWFARQMASMARDLLAQESVDATLGRITHAATELVEGCDAAGILVLRDDAVRTLAATDDLVVVSDRVQGELREGPCFDAAHSRTGERVYRIPDFTADAGRWPRYAPRAQELGVGSMMGFLLYTEDEDLGALNLYSRRPGAFTEMSELAGWLLASHAAIAFSSARTHAQMEEAVATRHVIGGHGHPHGPSRTGRDAGLRRPAPLLAGEQRQAPRGRPADLREGRPDLSSGHPRAGRAAP